MTLIQKSSPGIGFFDKRYVNVTGDTMTGSLTLNPSSGNATFILQTNGTARGRIDGETGGAMVLRSEGAFYFQSGGGNTRISILSTGEVGIGKFTPTEELHVIGNYLLDDQDTATKSYRFRTNGAALDVDFAGQAFVFSGFVNANYTGTQHYYLWAENDEHLIRLHGQWIWQQGNAGGDSGTEVFNIHANLSSGDMVVFNEAGSNYDFRMEGDTDVNLFFLDASTDRIGIGTNTPNTKFEVSGILSVKQGTSNSLAKVGGSIFDYFTDTTVGGAEADIYSSTLPANCFSANGDKVFADYGGNFVTVGTELTELFVKFAGTTIWDSTGVAPSTGTTSWRVHVELIRVSSTVIRYTVSLNTTGASGYVYAVSGELTGLTLSGTNILKLTGSSSGVGSGSGDIVGKMGSVSWIPAA